MHLKMLSVKGRPFCLGLSDGLSDAYIVILVMHICVSELGHFWFMYWPVAGLVPSHYMYQW